MKNNFNILHGSMVGLAAGIVTYIVLSYIGLTLGTFESSVIIGFPALLASLTSFVIS